MSLSRRHSLKSGPRSAWPVVRAMLSVFMVAGVYVFGFAVFNVIPVLALLLLGIHLLKDLYCETRESPYIGELPYGFAGHEFQVFSDAEGQVWIRVRDIRHLLGLECSDPWMAQAYPQGYRRAHPGVAAWYRRWRNRS